MLLLSLVRWRCAFCAHEGRKRKDAVRVDRFITSAFYFMPVKVVNESAHYNNSQNYYERNDDNS